MSAPLMFMPIEEDREMTDAKHETMNLDRHLEAKRLYDYIALLGLSVDDAIFRIDNHFPLTPNEYWENKVARITAKANEFKEALYKEQVAHGRTLDRLRIIVPDETCQLLAENEGLRLEVMKAKHLARQLSATASPSDDNGQPASAQP